MRILTTAFIAIVAATVAPSSPGAQSYPHAVLQTMFLEPDNVLPLSRQGIIPVGQSAAYVGAHLRKESQRWKEVVAAAGVSLE